MVKRRKIVIVDDQIANLSLGRNALSQDYEVYTVPSGEKLFLLLDKVMPDMILLDVEMPEMNGYEAIKILKCSPYTAHIPVIFLTAKGDAGSELEGLSLGAADYISKPFSPPLLRKRLEVQLLLKDYNDSLEEMVRRKTKTIVELKNAVLEIIADLVESRDNTTGGHILRTQCYLGILIDGMFDRGLYEKELSRWDTELLISSAQLHDVGKIAVSDSILQKTGKLTDEEFEKMKMHTVLGERIIERIQKRTTEQVFLDYAKVLAVSHHEKWNGSGYPYGLKNTNIPLPGRLMAIADVYDALVSERPYKPALPHDEAAQIIAGGSGTQFEPDLVDCFLSVSAKFDDATKHVNNEENCHELC